MPPSHQPPPRAAGPSFDGESGDCGNLGALENLCEQLNRELHLNAASTGGPQTVGSLTPEDALLLGLTPARWQELAHFAAAEGSYSVGYKRRIQQGKAVSVSSSKQWLRVKRRVIPLIRAGGLQLQQEQWLEAIDRKHRYGPNLRVYYEYWLSLDDTDPSYFQWLEHDGKDVDLPECPREVLEATQVHYCSAEEVLQYEVVVNAEGLLQNRLTGQLVDTGDAAPGTIPGVEGYLPGQQADAAEGLKTASIGRAGSQCSVGPGELRSASFGDVCQAGAPALAPAGDQGSSGHAGTCATGGAPAAAAAAAAPAHQAAAPAAAASPTVAAAEYSTDAVQSPASTAAEPPVAAAAAAVSGAAHGATGCSAGAACGTGEDDTQTPEKPKKPKDTFIYVMDTNRRLFIARKVRGTFHHSSFLKGAPLIAAGGVRVHQGALQRITAMSGHYKPTMADVDALVQVLSEKGVDMRPVVVVRQFKQQKKHKTKYLLNRNHSGINTAS